MQLRSFTTGVTILHRCLLQCAKQLRNYMKIKEQKPHSYKEVLLPDIATRLVTNKIDTGPPQKRRVIADLDVVSDICIPQYI